MTAAPSCPRSLLLTCRPEFTASLAEECLARSDSGTPIQAKPIASGAVLVNAIDSGGPQLPECIFERQRLVNPGVVPLAGLKPVAAETAAQILGSLASEKPLWTVHLLADETSEEEAGDTSRSRRLEGIWNTILRLGKKLAPDLEKRMRPPHRLKPGGIVLQLLLLPDGLWFTREEIGTMLNPRPGGFSRMRRDPLAPSRSHMKMEEALERMPVAPLPGERVIDLGAAPGGWTYAFVRRGCDVLAVDHGPMKLPEPGKDWGRVRHIRENGITFEPPPEWPHVDWLVADMLVAPGVALGLLRRWTVSGLARRLVVNVKLPQQEPHQALRPIEELMRGQKDYAFRIKQLYHDRREVTVMAWKHADARS